VIFWIAGQIFLLHLALTTMTKRQLRCWTRAWFRHARRAEMLSCRISSNRWAIIIVLEWRPEDIFLR
jgi:hypothetical protein